MSENTPSPTPSQENMYNEHNVVINKALDHVLSVQPQSYDDFMNGFTYLTKDDVKKKISINQSGLQVEAKATAKVNGRGQVKELGTKNESKIATPKSERISSSLETNMAVPDGRESQNIQNLESEDDLDEEVLTEGTKTSIMSKEVGATVTGQLKFDNFVDNCSDSEEDDISKEEEENESSGGYVASFAHIDSKTEGKEDKGQTFQSEAKLSPSVCETEECTGQENCLNPGEIEDVQDTPTVQDILKDTKLDFSAQFKTAEEMNNSTSDQVCSDEVEPFTLDEDFDYDNVKLTPKYSVEDLQLMKTLREQNQEYTD